jgi:RHS repeat-associated protein
MNTPCNAAVASGGYLVTTNVYFNTGELQQSTDPCLYSTTYLYSASYFGAYPTTVTNPLGQQTTSGYDFNTGLVTSVTDPNSKTTTKTYDIMDRLTGISYPDGGSTGYCYTDMGGSTCTISQAPPYQAVVTDAITSSLNETATILFDGLGRPTQTQLNSDPDGTTYTLTTYDALGRKSKVYNPTRCSTPTSNCKNETTWGYTTTKYDVLNRVTSVVEQDGSTVGTNYAAYPCTTVTDEVGTSRQSCLDGLGRMTSVVEDPGSSPHLNYQTSYLYDVLGNMTSVTQNGSNSANARNRSFLYDSLSRLTSATNPESGTITYAYDADGNVITKTAPKPNQTTGTATVTTTDTYDQLNRLVEKAFVGITTPALQYGYDGTSLSGCGQAPPSIASPTNLIGRRSSMCSGMSASSWSYDPMGRPLLESRTNVTPADELCTGAGKYRVCSKYSYAIPLNVGYLYNLDGSLSTLTYPSGDQVTYTPGGAGRSLGLSDSANSFVANGTANHATYAPNGALATMANGYTSTPVFAGIVTSNFYNDRLQPISLSASAGGNAVSSFCFDFHLGVQVQATGDCSAITAYTTGDNGNLFQITNNVATNNVNSLGTAVFAYDSLNRIKQAKTVSTSSNCWGEAYTIDAWGNLTGRTNIGATGCVSEGSLSYAVNTSNQYTQLSGVTYDIAGNVLDDGNGNKPTYDAENTMATDAGVTYDYDADGVRIEKSSGTLYWTGSGGEYLTETDLTGTINEEYIYFNGERIARVDRPSGTVHYYYSDHLGSSSVIADASGNIEQQYVYFPYGGMVDSTGTDPNHYKFTGKERDTESGLDEFGARYYASSLGRFLIPDWADKPIAVPYAHFGNPQSLNLYSYVQNNPTTFGDPDGHENEGPPVNSSGAGAWPVLPMCSLCPIPDSAQVTDANLAAQQQEQQQTGEHHGFWWNVGHALGFVHTDAEKAQIFAEQRAAMLKTLVGKLCRSGASGCSSSIDSRLQVATQVGNQGLKGGNWNFYLASGEKDANGNDIPSSIETQGCGFGRCGLGPSLHTHSDGSMHLDTMNSFSFFGVGAAVHAFVDVLGGNTWWSGGIPR